MAGRLRMKCSPRLLPALLALPVLACACGPVCADKAEDTSSSTASLVLLQISAELRPASIAALPEGGPRPEFASPLNANVLGHDAVEDGGSSPTTRRTEAILETSAAVHASSGSRGNSTLQRGEDGQQDYLITFFGCVVVMGFYVMIVKAFYDDGVQKHVSVQRTPLAEPTCNPGIAANFASGLGTAISSKFLQVNQDFPLSLPLDSLSDPVWSIDITGATGAPLLSAALNSTEGHGRHLQVYDSIRKEHPVGTANGNLDLFRAGGHPLGKLEVEAGGRYRFREHGNSAARAVIVVSDDGQQIKVSSGQKNGRDLATLIRHQSREGQFLEVTTVSGTDVVLVLLLVLAIVAFSPPPRFFGPVGQHGSPRPTRSEG